MSTVTRTASEIVRNTFNFSVDKFPLSGPDNMATPFYGLFRSDTQDVVSDRAVSKQYVPHTTDDVCALVEAAQSAFDSECVVKCHFRLGHYVSVAPSREHRLSVYGDNDNVFPRIVIRAGYDGRSFKATMGYYRDLCRNLAMMRQVGGTTVTIRHGSGLRSKMDNLINDFRGLGDGWDNLRHRIRRMEDSTVVLDRFLIDSTVSLERLLVALPPIIATAPLQFSVACCKSVSVADDLKLATTLRSVLGRRTTLFRATCSTTLDDARVGMVSLIASF